ncbi:uncharacterized protein LOC100141552 isoform X2 [Tribolium castaneum]|uniref:uncharacterized protein LOC100141552 isoform X2 n=1 Tax=Tribolium castaneum TaxID=7070 RepID=UPI00017583FF|nr:PREDICTED: uncharacterized protein LOC100141552 [Tribolium castaneum]XP_008194584.2 PREDICTED: uncharacterized protein LOC100141552 [Tribolium castaneum]|eukprot:XP_008194583.2 PREDICTED: uncharacterized protein LOC100141552 [Tribolium castaneum]
MFACAILIAPAARSALISNSKVYLRPLSTALSQNPSLVQSPVVQQHKQATLLPAVRSFQTTPVSRDIDSAAKFIGAGAATVGVAGSGETRTKPTSSATRSCTWPRRRATNTSSHSSTDIDGRTAQELAGMNNRDDILRFLDGVHAKLEAGDKKKAKARPRRFTFNKRQVKKEQVQEKLEKRMNKGHHRPSMIETLKTRIKSGSIWGRPLRGSAPSWDAEFGVGAEAGARRRLQGAPESK